MIQFDGAGKTFRVAPGPGRKAGTVVAVRAVSLAIEPGTVTGVVGPNGAGKTTLFGLLLGFLEPTAGSVSIAGMEPRAYVRRHGAGYLPERFQLPRDWTVRAGLRALLDLDGSARAVDGLLNEFDLMTFATASVHTLSRGTMQRIGVAQAVATPRDLVVFDEPTEGLDPLWRVRFRELITRLRSPGRVILIASHDLVEIERLADRAVIMRDGTIAETVELHHGGDGPRVYTLSLAAPHAGVGNFFTDARPASDTSFAITVADAADLSARLAALIEDGALIASVAPAPELEQRVTRDGV